MCCVRHVTDSVAAELAGDGARVLAPYLRGFGATRFVSDETPRVGQQAAIGRDVLDLINAAGLRTRQQHEEHCTRLLDHRLVPSGHNQPTDAHAEVARAVRDVRFRLTGSGVASRP